MHMLSPSPSRSPSFSPLHMSHYCKENKKGTCEVFGTPDPANKVLYKDTYTVCSLAYEDKSKSITKKNLRHLSHVIMQLELYVHV